MSWLGGPGICGVHQEIRERLGGWNLLKEF